mmetsp:Transcript_129021/g.306094  ORF Transcript_129021/g.306094 Transcript_129021/m.306094 type:complete len:218 (-) Transcript_129021:86-739(-)
MHVELELLPPAETLATQSAVPILAACALTRDTPCMPCCFTTVSKSARKLASAATDADLVATMTNSASKVTLTTPSMAITLSSKAARSWLSDCWLAFSTTCPLSSTSFAEILGLRFLLKTLGSPRMNSRHSRNSWCLSSSPLSAISFFVMANAFLAADMSVATIASGQRSCVLRIHLAADTLTRMSGCVRNLRREFRMRPRRGASCSFGASAVATCSC